MTDGQTEGRTAAIAISPTLFKKKSVRIHVTSGAAAA